jgi:hypothetical protein
MTWPKDLSPLDLLLYSAVPLLVGLGVTFVKYALSQLHKQDKRIELLVRDLDGLRIGLAKDLNGASSRLDRDMSAVKSDVQDLKDSLGHKLNAVTQRERNEMGTTAVAVDALSRKLEELDTARRLMVHTIDKDIERRLGSLEVRVEKIPAIEAETSLLRFFIQDYLKGKPDRYR